MKPVYRPGLINLLMPEKADARGVDRPDRRHEARLPAWNGSVQLLEEPYLNT
jgi:hypothetical protein